MEMLKLHSDFYPFINIHSHDIDLIGEVETAIYKLNKLTSGQTLFGTLKRLANEGKRLTIHASRDFKNLAKPELSPLQQHKYRLEKCRPHQLEAMAYELCTKKRSNHKTEGVNANVFFNPMQAREPDRFGVPQMAQFHFNNHFTLGHVLIHAMRMMKGNYQGGAMELYNKDNPIQQREELRAFGLGEFYRRPVSENKMREESGLLPYMTTR